MLKPCTCRTVKLHGSLQLSEQKLMAQNEFLVNLEQYSHQLTVSSSVDFGFTIIWCECTFMQIIPITRCASQAQRIDNDPRPTTEKDDC